MVGGFAGTGAVAIVDQAGDVFTFIQTALRAIKPIHFLVLPFKGQYNPASNMTTGCRYTSTLKILVKLLFL